MSYPIYCEEHFTPMGYIVSNAVKRILPISGGRYTVTETGKVFNRDGTEIFPIKIAGEWYVLLEWFDGKKEYPLGLVVLITYQEMDLPDLFWNNIQPLYRDGNSENVFPVNLTYRFKTPIEVEKHPGFYYVPFYTKYAINIEGVLITVDTGYVKTWSVIKPTEVKNKRNGYHYTRVVARSGYSRNLFRYRALWFTFGDYDGRIHDMVVNHIDGNASNDVLSNLELTTYTSNNQHAVDTGLRSRVFPVLVKDLITGDITRYKSIADCSRATGYHGSLISYRARNSVGKVFSDRKLFKFDDNTPWPDIDPCNIPNEIRFGAWDIKARNVFTGEIVIFTGSAAGEALLNVHRGVISRHLRLGSVIPSRGYNFKLLDDMSPWPQHTARHLAIYSKYPDNPSDGLIVTDKNTGEETFYLGVKEFSEEQGIPIPLVNNYIQRHLVYKKHFLLTAFDLRKTLPGPAQ